MIMMMMMMMMMTMLSDNNIDDNTITISLVDASTLRVFEMKFLCGIPGDVHTTKSDGSVVVHCSDSGGNQLSLLRYCYLPVPIHRAVLLVIGNQHHSRARSDTDLLRATSLRLVLRQHLVLDRLHPARLCSVRRHSDRKLRDGHVRRASRAFPVSP